MSSEHRKCLASFSVSLIGGRCAPFGRKDGWIFLSRLDFASKPIIEENVAPKSFRITLSANLDSTALQLCPVIRICTGIPFSRRPMPLLQCQHWQHRHSSSGSTSTHLCSLGKVARYVDDVKHITSDLECCALSVRVLSPMDEYFIPRGSWHCPTCNLGVPPAPPGETYWPPTLWNIIEDVWLDMRQTMSILWLTKMLGRCYSCTRLM